MHSDLYQLSIMIIYYCMESVCADVPRLEVIFEVYLPSEKMDLMHVLY